MDERETASMTAIAHRSTAVQMRTRREHASPRSAHRMRLMASGDGWSLVGHEGEVVFQALGVSGRRRCLEAARERGVLAVLS
jgi:hypothetical protein